MLKLQVLKLSAKTLLLSHVNKSNPWNKNLSKERKDNA